MSEETEQPQEEPKLLGDMVEDVLHALGGEKVAEVIKTITKKPCNCGERKQRLNAFDYNIRNRVKDLIKKRDAKNE